MKEYILLLLKGIIIGFGKIIPGVSGSLLAMSLGVYEKSIYKIKSFFLNTKENISYFTFLGIGILISIMFGSKLILFLLSNYYVLTIFLFIGLILGIIPNILNKNGAKNIKYYGITLLTIIITMFILNIKSIEVFVYKNNFMSNIQIMFMGFLEAFTMIVPGISGTAIFLILGYYEFIMQLFSNIFPIILENTTIIIIFFSSFIISVYLVSLLVSFMLSKFEKVTYSIILGFTISSILLLLKEVLPKVDGLIEFGLSLILMVVGYFVSKKFE